MNIIHIKHTNIAQSPEAISNIINKYTEHKSIVVFSPKNLIHINNADIIHYHNKIDKYFNKNCIIQYHSEPGPRVHLNTGENITKLVIAQYHATLPEYKDCIIVRNPIDIYDNIYNNQINNQKITIGYSPSITKKQNIWFDKGYPQTVDLLNKLKNKYKNLIDICIITNKSLIECLKLKQRCNILIDELITGSYHRCSLEGLALGALTICYLKPEIEKIFLNHSKSSFNPIINTNIDNAEKVIDNIISLGINYITNIGYQNKAWMEKYWNPKDIAKEYTDIYHRHLLNQ